MGELIFNGLLLIFFVFVTINGNSITVLNDYVGARYWPMMLSGIAVLIFTVKVFGIWKNLPAEERKFSLGETFGFNNPRVLKLLLAFVLMIGYVVLLPYGGFILTTTLFTAGISYILGSKSIKKSLLTGIGVVIPIFAVFVWGLGVRAPRGIGALYYFSLWIENIWR